MLAGTFKIPVHYQPHAVDNGAQGKSRAHRDLLDLDQAQKDDHDGIERDTEDVHHT